MSIAAAATPAVSRMAARSDIAGMRSTVASAIALMLSLNVPATLGLIVLARPIVALNVTLVALIGYRYLGFVDTLLHSGALQLTRNQLMEGGFEYTRRLSLANTNGG